MERQTTELIARLTKGRPKWAPLGNHSVPSQTYTCDGYTSLNGAAAEQDQGRLQLVFPTFWVQFAKSDGHAVFQLTKFLPQVIKFKISNDGNQTWYTGKEAETTFTLKRGINDLRIAGPQMIFIGNCILALLSIEFAPAIAGWQSEDRGAWFKDG